jgi:hypothetical protein
MKIPGKTPRDYTDQIILIIYTSERTQAEYSSELIEKPTGAFKFFDHRMLRMEVLNFKLHQTTPTFMMPK